MENNLKAEKKNIKISFDLKNIFVHFTKAIASAATLDISGAIGELIDAGSETITNNSAENAAYKLIKTAMAKAVCELVKELNTSDVFPINVKESAKQLSGSFKLMDLNLNDAFFNAPQNSEPVKKMQEILRSWLTQMEVKPADINVIINRFNSYVVFALHDEWRSNKEKYTIILDYLDTPFTAALQNEQEWKRYRAYLEKQVNESVFASEFGLKDIYIPLEAYYKKRDTGEKEIISIVQARDDKEQEVVNVGNMERYLKRWLDNGTSNDAVRIISGAPGTGKSSFAKMFAHNISSQYKVLYIKLHLYNFRLSTIEEAVQYYFKEHFSLNLFDENKLIIIFDGLDELSQQGKTCAELAKQFADEVYRYAEINNKDILRVQILITGRNLAVQSNHTIFRKEEQILYIKPYSETQRDKWWKNYGKFSKKNNYQKIPEELLEQEKLNELSTVPLLNYLIALSYESGKIDFSKTVNLNDIYADLIDRVFERGYESNIHGTIRDITKEDFFEILEEIAVSAWHNAGRTTTIKEIKKRCDQSEVHLPIEEFEQNAEKGVLNLLTAFYFKQSDKMQGSERTFEFTHKSFGEYLIAKRIIKQLKWMYEDLSEKKFSRRGGKSEKGVLHDWILLCGKTRLNNDIFSFIQDEMILCNEKENGKEVVQNWKLMLCKLISYMLKKGMPFETLAPRFDFYEETRQSGNAEQALLACLSACSRVTDEISNIDWSEDNTIAGTWINQLRGQRRYKNNSFSFALEFLNHINLEKCFLATSDLCFANLYKANLEYAILIFSNLSYSNLSYSNLSGANLRRADLREANLRRADLREANLSYSNLSGAYLSGAYLSGAYLRRADLREADLSGADLRGADLEKAIFLKSDLENIDLEASGAKNVDKIFIEDDE